MQTTISFYVEREGEELELTILGDVEPYTPARLSGHPDSWYPAEGGDVTIDSILLDDDLWDGELTSRESSLVEDALAVQALQDEEEARTEAAIEAYEESKFDCLHF